MLDLFNRLYSAAFDNYELLEKLKINSILRGFTLLIANFWLPIRFKTTRKGKIEALRPEGCRIIVTLTSFPRRISKIWIVIECLLRQTIKPDVILLYLSRKQFPGEMSDVPLNLLFYVYKGLKIIFVDDDLRSHKKYYYAMQDYPNDLVITVDDDIFYPTTLIAELINAHRENPKAVICRYARQLRWDENGNLLSRHQWGQFYHDSDSSREIFFGTGGGVLFPAPGHCLYSDTFDLSLSQKLCPLEDDLWLNTMIRLQGTPIICVIKYKLILNIIIKKNISLSTQNTGADGQTNVQMENVNSHYIAQGLRPYAQNTKCY